MASKTADQMPLDEERLAMHLNAIFSDDLFKKFILADIAAEKQTFDSQAELIRYISARLAELLSSEPKPSALRHPSNLMP